MAIEQALQELEILQKLIRKLTLNVNQVTLSKSNR
jgi:hypothetical protein